MMRLMVAVCLGILSISPALAIEKPNFVVILADDCTFRDLGCYGGQALTPNIDRLATEGMKFERCFQAAPMCSPTRHNLYTGLYPVKSGAYPNHTFAKPGTRNIAHFLKDQGYRVALSGKTHINAKQFPFEYSGKKNPDMQAVDQLFADSVESKQPFCLFACSNEPHTPWNQGDASAYPPEKIKLPPYIVDTPEVREEFSRYLAEITYYDGQVGQILDLLKKHELVDNTLVMVLSEQGNSLPFAKWTCYGNGLQSAMIVRWPGRVPGRSTQAMVEYVDVTPTLLEAAGAPAEDGLDGKSFLNVLLGHSDRHKTESFGIMTTRGIINGTDLYAIRSIRNERFRLIWNLNHESRFENALTQSSAFKSMQRKAQHDEDAARWVKKYHQRPEFELYDCQADPLEMNNLADDPELTQLREQMHERLRSWMASQGDQGVQTEREAVLHQGRYRKLSPEDAYQAYEKQRAKGSKNK